MKIAIIGHGNVGGALAKNWASKGHQIIIGTRKSEDPKATTLAQHTNIGVASILTAVQEAEVVLVATPPQIAVELSKNLGDLSGKVLIDATNTIRQGPDPYETAFHAFKALTQATVVKCFNTTGFENMANPVYDGMAIDMFVAGDDEKAKAIAMQLSKDAGFANCYDFGGDAQVKALEHFAFAWINLAIMQKQGRNIAFKVLKR